MLPYAMSFTVEATCEAGVALIVPLDVPTGTRCFIDADISPRIDGILA